MKNTSMKVTDLKKLLDEYIENGFGDATVVILNNAKNKDNNEHDVVEALKKKNVYSSRKQLVEIEYVKSCGYETDCYTPGRSCLYTHCRTCADGGIGHYTKEKLSPKHGEPALVIEV